MKNITPNSTTYCGRITGQATIYLGKNEENRYTKKPVSRGTLFVAILCAVVVLSILTVALVNAEADGMCWVLCKPGTQVNIRLNPDKNSKSIGWLEVGDSFRTDGESRNGFIHAFGVGDTGEGWIYCGYVVSEEPEEVGQEYTCVANKKVICRRWVQGPQVRNNGKRVWLRNGSTVSVFYIADGWAVTSRGYIQAEWLEVGSL